MSLLGARFEFIVEAAVALMVPGSEDAGATESRRERPRKKREIRAAADEAKG